MEKLRIDKYLWAIRLFKTRSKASDACDGGKVKLNGINVKAAKPVSANDIYDVHTEGKQWKIRVKELLHARKSYQEAILYYEDLTPPEDEALKGEKFKAPAFYTGKRQSKIGRPTKRNRRQIDDFFDPLAE